MKSDRKSIILVENNDHQAELIAEIARNSRLNPQITRVKSAKEAMDYIGRMDLLKDRRLMLPDLILIDLNEDNQPGLDLIEFVKLNSSLSSVPVVALTTESTSQEISMAYCLGANSCVQLGNENEAIMKIVETVMYWLVTSVPVADLLIGRRSINHQITEPTTALEPGEQPVIANRLNGLVEAESGG
ncbi:MAG TPA: response regulator [candidate division Zixibacteria bacterium]|mgnify:CR=1 FL=1|nr:response regulator [candidate division Zixibacteria bacterium]